MSKFFKCTCGSEAVELEIDIDFEAKYSPSLYMSMWRLGSFSRVLSLKGRIRWMWHILRTGMPWTDSITFNYKQVIEFKEVLNNACSELAVAQENYEKELNK